MANAIEPISSVRKTKVRWDEAYSEALSHELQHNISNPNADPFEFQLLAVKIARLSLSCLKQTLNTFKRESNDFIDGPGRKRAVQATKPGFKGIGTCVGAGAAGVAGAIFTGMGAFGFSEGVKALTSVSGATLTAVSGVGSQAHGMSLSHESTHRIVADSVNDSNKRMAEELAATARSFDDNSQQIKNVQDQEEQRKFETIKQLANS